MICTGILRVVDSRERRRYPPVGAPASVRWGPSTCGRQRTTCGERNGLVRIVSMLSSATEIVYALGLQEHLVAISHECDYPPEALRLPRASRSRFDPAGMTSGEIDAAVRRSMEEHGSVYEVDAGRLRELRPDVVLTQAVCEVCAVPTGSVREAVEGLDHAPEVVSLDAHTVEGILQSMLQVADAAGY